MNRFQITGLQAENVDPDETFVATDGSTFTFPDAEGVTTHEGCLLVLDDNRNGMAAFSHGQWQFAMAKGTRFTARPHKLEDPAGNSVIDHVGLG